MKDISKYLIFFIILNIHSQEIEKSNLFGKWNFVNMTDPTGKIITERKLRHNSLHKAMGYSGMYKIEKPDFLLNKNGKCSTVFEECESCLTKRQSGVWEINKNELILTMKISRKDSTFKKLKRWNLISKKSKNGFYDQKPMIKRIKFLRNDSLVIYADVGYLLIYKKE